MNAMLHQTFIAKTKNGLCFTLDAQNTAKKIVTNFKVACIPTQQGRVYCIELTQAEAKELHRDMPKAYIALEDQAEWLRFDRACLVERVELENARPKSLEKQRAALVSAEYNLYSPENFPGSKAWHKWNQAGKAIEAFDKAHPEVKAHVKQEADDGFIPTEGGMNL